MTRAAPRLTLLLLPLCLAGCPQEDETKKPPVNTTSPTGGTSTGGAGGLGGEGGSGGGGGAAGGGVPAGGGGAGGSTLCGNGTLDPGEACDGDALGDATCRSLGFPGGTLACSAACALDFGACTGADSCADGIDNDSDGMTDCEEADCQAACADPCAAPVVLEDGADTPGSTLLHADVLAASCTAESGPEVVYQVTATVATGMLDVILTEDGSAQLSVSVRDACAPAAAELACDTTYEAGRSLTKQISMPITIGQTVFVVVDGDGAAEAGTYSLLVQSRPVACGDGIQDPSEACDDANTASGDGCSAACAVESTELEPNDTAAAANPFAAPWFAQISPAGDVDTVQIDVPATASLVVTATGLGPATCSDGSLDSRVTILDPGGNVIAVNDDAPGLGFCSRAIAPGVAPGTYRARVEASLDVTPAAATFPYALAVDLFPCGDGVVSPGEECDDANATNGDGCSAACKLEVDESEPNGTLAQADAYTSPWVARIDPDGDVDVVSVTVPAGSSSITAKTSDPTGGDACFTTTDTFVEILGPGGAVLAEDDDTGSYCSFVTAEGLAPGTYFVRVQAPPGLGMSVSYVYPYALDVTVQ